MKHLNLLKSTLLLFALVVGSTSLWAQEAAASWSYTVVNGDASKLNTTAKTFTVDATHVWNYAVTVAAGTNPSITIGKYSDIYGIKFGESGSKYYSPVILSTEAFNDYVITKVRIKIKHNGKKVGTLTVKQGSTTIGTATTDNTNEWITVTCSETSKGEGGTLSIQYEVAQAIYLNKIEVWYEMPITAAKTYTTLTSANALDFTNVSNLKAYIATEVDGGNVNMTQVNKVPAGTGLVLKATTTGSAINVPAFISGDADDVSTNKLAGSATETTAIAANAGYILSDGVFQPASAGTLPAGKAYLNIAVASAHPLSLDFGDGDVTGIESLTIMPSRKGEGMVYDLQGRRVAQPAKGLYIVNGKKVFVP